jgi:hypothetical protein
MPTSDPVAALARLGRRLQRNPNRFTAHDGLRVFRLVAEAVEQRPDWVASLGADDLTLVINTLLVPATVFNHVIEETPSRLDEITSEADLQAAMRFATPTVRWYVQRRLDAIRGARAH